MSKKLVKLVLRENKIPLSQAAQTLKVSTKELWSVVKILEKKRILALEVEWDPLDPNLKPHPVFLD
ncbi:MAG: hypothetical protein GF334_02255, partial [Candidatus Altiarchaeales archaeon]|nr:hypothetical protein [Candidatus Altiarchaeales archaeon]